MEKEILRLKEENENLKKQLFKVRANSAFFKQTTEEYINCSESEKELKFKIFKRFIEKININPKNIYDESLKNFYQFIVQHLELQKLQEQIKYKKLT